MGTPEEANALIETANGVELGEQTIFCEMAKNPPPPKEERARKPKRERESAPIDKEEAPKPKPKKSRGRQTEPYVRISGFPEYVLVTDILELFPEAQLTFVNTFSRQGEYRASVRCETIEQTRALAATEGVMSGDAPIVLELIGDEPSSE